MLELENQLHNAGYNYIACVDEVGRGCLAGDVVACAIIMPKNCLIPGVKDSKKISPKKREELYNIILEKAIGIGIGMIEPSIIDEVNIKEATRLAMKKAILNIKDKNGHIITPDYILIDAESIPIDIAQKSIIKGDEKSHGIQCASIIAKVYRDKLCEDWDKEYPGYKIYKNKGYGTLEHRKAVKELGPSAIHRKTFLKKII